MEKAPNVGQIVLPANPAEQASLPADVSSPFPGCVSGLPIQKTSRRLPHWTCESVIYWVTFRMADSLAQNVLDLWREERGIWLRHNPEPWDERQWYEYNLRFGDRLDRWSDAGHGSCALAKPHVRELLQGCLLRFERDRLRLHAATIMPNHVHLLMEPMGGNALSQLMKGIKGASARKINLLTGASGQFWMDESFDHIVRSEAQYEHFAAYIRDNPVKAGLQESEYWHYTSGAASP